jgi:hypothetical protein
MRYSYKKRFSKNKRFHSTRRRGGGLLDNLMSLGRSKEEHEMIMEHNRRRKEEKEEEKEENRRRKAYLANSGQQADYRANRDQRASLQKEMLDYDAAFRVMKEHKLEALGPQFEEVEKYAATAAAERVLATLAAREKADREAAARAAAAVAAAEERAAAKAAEAAAAEDVLVDVPLMSDTAEKNRWYMPNFKSLFIRRAGGKKSRRKRRMKKRARKTSKEARFA